MERAMQHSEEWVQYFRGNGLVAMRIPWHLGADLTADEKAAIAHSIRLFQLGENSEGRHLMQYAREWAARLGDSAYVEAIRLFIAEERRHSSALARFMEINGIAPITRGFSDSVFRRMRNILGTLELSLSVLVTAEIIAKVYYPALHAATESEVLKIICEQVCRDEIAHVEFQTAQLARLRANRSRTARLVTGLLHRMLFYPTAMLVAFSHRAVVRRAGLRWWSFMRRCRREFLLDLAAMNPRRQAASQMLPSRSRAGEGPELRWKQKSAASL